VSVPEGTAADPVLLDDDAAVAAVLDLVAARLEVMTPVAASKWLAGTPVADTAREQAVLEGAAVRASALGLTPEPVRAFFALQIEFSRARQEALHADWRRTGCAACSTPPDLAALRAQIDAINRDLLETLYLAAPALARANFVDGATASASQGVATTQRLAATLPDPLDRQRLLERLHAIRIERPADLARIRTSGVLRIGTTGDYAPFSLESGGRVHGADIELARALAARLGLRPVFMRTSWPTLLADLAAQRFDVVLSGISITPERRAHGRFSRPYQSGGKTLVARCADGARFRTLAQVDHRRVRVVVNPGGTNERYVREHLRRARILVHADNRSVFDEILAGRADVMITDDVEAELQALRHPQLCRTMPGTLNRSDKAVFMIDDAALESAVNAWLADAIARGLPARALQAAMRP
jgi:cyclohexadienyl dehydratase